MNHNPKYHISIEQFQLPSSKEEPLSLGFYYLKPDQVESLIPYLEEIGNNPFTQLQDLPDYPVLFLYHIDGTDEETNIKLIVCRPSSLENALINEGYEEDEEAGFSVLDSLIICPLLINPTLYAISFFQSLVESNNLKETNFHFINGFIA